MRMQSLVLPVRVRQAGDQKPSVARAQGAGYQVLMLKMAHAQALSELSDYLYPFLPASGARYTFREAAHEAGVDGLWVHGPGISKRTALPAFLKDVYQQRPQAFEKLINRIVQGGMDYKRRVKNEPVTRE